MIGVASLLFSSHACWPNDCDDVDGCHLVSTSLMRGARATIEDDNAAADVDDDGVRLMASWILLTRIITKKQYEYDESRRCDATIQHRQPTACERSAR